MRRLPEVEYFIAPGTLCILDMLFSMYCMWLCCIVPRLKKQFHL
jgi:hypothetical protein